MKNKIILVLYCLLAGIVLSATAGETAMRPIKKNRTGVPPYEVIEDVMRGNQKSTEAIARQSSTSDDPAHMTWLSDNDARLQPTLVHVAPQDKVYTVRNPANQLILSLGAIDYGIRYLFTPILLITGNTDNSAIRFFMEGYEKLDPSLRQNLDHLHLPLAATPDEAETKLPFEERWLRNIEKNVDYQVKQALARYGDRVENGRLVVVGAVIDLSNQYGHGEKKLIIINVNGETEGKVIKEHRQLTRLDQKLLSYVGRERIKPDKAAKMGGMKKTIGKPKR